MVEDRVLMERLRASLGGASNTASNVTQVTGTAMGDAADGMVEVDIGGGNPPITVPTTGDVRAGDSVPVQVVDGRPTATAPMGSGERTRQEIAGNYAKLNTAIAEVRADADAHGEQIDAVKQDIAAYKASAQATYATKTEVDDKTGAITKTLTADYTKTADLAATDAVKDAKKAGTDAQGQLADYMESNDAAVADAKAAGTGASAALDSYKDVVSEMYAEKTELTEAVNQLSSTMTSNYSAFTTYRTSNDTAVSKAQSDATNAQSTIDSYKTSNDKAVADAKAAGTTAQDQLSAYKGTNDQAVADAKAAGTSAQSNLDSYKTATDQRLDELKNIADNAIETWYLKGAPTTSNAPAKDWTTDALKKRHAGDLYMDTDTGYSYRWSGTAWVQVKDSDVTKALKEIESVKTDYATKSELSATDTELSGKVSDVLTTAKSYTDSSLEQEVTARNAAIKAQADSISLDVSRTYTRSETFASYQSDADGRIATANSNASTAVSTAQTAASDAATAKTDASSAVSTANSANTKSESAVSTANSAVSTANSAKSTANAASSTASAAKSTADGAAKQANLYTIGLGDAGPVAKWIHLGTLTSAGNASSATISIVFGSGYNGNASQNSKLTITIKDGWQSTPSATKACGVTAMRENCDNALVDVLAQSATVYDVWVYAPWEYSDGRYSISGQYAAWQHSGATQKDEPATSETQVKQDVAYRLADATKAQTMAAENHSSIKQLSDSITSEVTERSKLAGRVGTLESTSGTHASKLEQLATSIKSLVKGESTYTDPDGKSATSGIYSLVTQTRDSVTALFGQYTKTADLGSTAAVKDAKKAGTDAQAAASAAQTTADSAKSTAQDAKSAADGASRTAADASKAATKAGYNVTVTTNGTTYAAAAYSSGALMSAQEIAKVGVLAWYKGGTRVATGVTCAVSKGATECRLES